MTSEPQSTIDDKAQQDSPPIQTQKGGSRNFSAQRKDQIEERVIPLVAEKLETTKKPVTDYVIIRKIPVTETKTIQVPVSYEKVIVERRPSNGQRIFGDEKFGGTVLGGSGIAVINSSDGSNAVLKSVSEVIIPVLREEVEIKKNVIVSDEVVITKKLVSGIEKITEQVRSETVQTEPGTQSIMVKKPDSSSETVTL